MRRFRLRTLRWFAALLFLSLLAAIILRWVSLERWRWNTEHATTEYPIAPRPLSSVPEPTVKPEPTPPKPKPIAGKLETARLFNGITFRSVVEPTPGRAASEERDDPQSYVLDLKLGVRMPAPNRTIEELAKVNPELPRLLPGLPEMLKPEAVSPFFAELYETKLKSLRANLGRLDQLLSRHNFYDCQTVLQLKHPQTQRKAVLLQADMDVDADGSDADRIPAGTATSPNFQPFTSYRWGKKTQNPSAYLPVLDEKAKRFEAEAALKATTADRKRELKGAIAQTRDEIGSLKTFSFLIGATDPFIVIPGGFTRTDGAKVGDYAVVISGDAIYPALVGDIGPNDKTGEASLRIAKEISASATANYRPVSDLKVTYLVFPGTAETPFGPPDLDKINARCEALVSEIGGASKPLHKWINIIPPPPTPTPTPSPTPSPGPSPSASPAASVSPAISPSPTFAFSLPTPSVTPSAVASPSPSPQTSPTPTSSASAKASPASKKHRRGGTRSTSSGRESSADSPASSAITRRTAPAPSA